MNEEFRSRLDPTKRRAGSESNAAEDATKPPPDDGDAHPPERAGAFSMVSADRRQKTMLELRFMNGNAKALAYSYLVSIDFNPSVAIRMDFSGYDVRIAGRNLGSLFAALVAQRVAVVTETDDLHAEATVPNDATVVTRIDVKGPPETPLE